MALSNNGYKRATKLIVDVLVNGVVQSSPEFPLMESFTQSGTTYPAVTSTQIAQMSTADYNDRVTAYAAYVTANYQTQYPGLSVSATGARVYDATSCPLP